MLRRGSSGFTLVELLVVVAILGILVSIVSVSVIGMVGRGGNAAYESDERTIQTLVATFYADGHCFNSRLGWNEEGNCTTGHYFPTQHGNYSALRTSELVDVQRRVVLREAGGFANATDIEQAAIWMGLLVNEPRSGRENKADQGPGDANSPLKGEGGPYLQEIPESCSRYNHLKGTGTYTWIVGNLGRVYGCYQEGDRWYAGFSGQYP